VTGDSISSNTVYCLLPLSAGCICAFIAIYLFAHRQQRGAKPLALSMAAIALWSIAYAMEFRSPSLADKLWWVKVEYVGASWVGFLCLLFTLAITERKKWLTPGRLWYLAVIPVAFPLLAFTNEYHGLMWEKAWLDMRLSTPVVAYVRGVAFWTITAYAYALLLAATLILLQFYRRSVGSYRRQAGIILLGIAVPWLSNALYVFGRSPVPGLDLTPFAFTVSGIILCFGLFWFQLLDIVPIAREALLEAIGDAVLVLDMQDRIVDKNSEADRLIENGLGRVTPQGTFGVLSVILNEVRKLKEQERNESEIQLGPEGRRKDYHLQVSPLLSRKDRLVGLLVCLRDITESKRSEAALRDSEEKFRGISDNALDGIIMIDPEGKISLWNRAAETMFGYKEGEILGKELHTVLVPRRYHPEYMQRFAEFIMTGAGPVIGKTMELSALKEDGTEFPIELSVSSLSLKGHRHAVGIVRDITGRKQDEAERARLHDRLQRAQKMEAIGTLAGGVAHDLNNILSGIVSYPDLLLTQIPADSPLSRPLQTIRRSGKKAADVVQDLLTLARRGVPANEVVCLNTVVSEYLGSQEYARLYASHPRLRVTAHLDENLPNIMGSSLHLSKTIMNLVINAAEAMPDGGPVHIRTSTTHITQPIKGHEEVKAGRYVRLAISDAGVGIPEKDQARIFEPFYTKKHMGRSGTGLGMAVVWGTVKDHRGYIDIESAEGVGTTVTLYLPVTDRKSESPSEPVGEELCQGKGETILVVDDMAEQRTLASLMLGQLGYAVETVESGEAALRLLKDHQVDLVILDMIMDPGMDGLETYLEIKKEVPRQKVLIASGFSENERVHAAQRSGAGGYLKKPYSTQTLSVMVRKELNRKDPDGSPLGKGAEREQLKDV